MFLYVFGCLVLSMLGVRQNELHSSDKIARSYFFPQGTPALQDLTTKFGGGVDKHRSLRAPIVRAPRGLIDVAILMRKHIEANPKEGQLLGLGA